MLLQPSYRLMLSPSVTRISLLLYRILLDSGFREQGGTYAALFFHQKTFGICFYL